MKKDEDIDPYFKKDELDQDSQQINKDVRRQPVCCYCKYNVNHSFKSIKERDTHQELCPDRSTYDKNAARTSEIYNRNKPWIEEMRQKKKQVQSEVMDGLSNQPDAKNYPVLTYKYVMNEPFVAGSSAQIQCSTDQVQYKRKKNYESQNQTEVKISNEFDFKKQIQEEWSKQAEDINPEQASTLIIKQDCEDLFGLDVIYRQNYSLNLFDFDIEKYINLQNLKELTQIDFDDFTQCKSFIQNNLLLKLNVLAQENEQGWRSLGMEMLNNFQNMSQINSTSNTMILNTTKGKNLQSRSESNQDFQIYFVLVTKFSEGLGSYLDCDFALLKVEVEGVSNEYEENKLMDQDKKELYQQKQSLVEENQDLKNQLNEIKNQISVLQTDVDDRDKIIRDRDRSAKQDKRNIEYLESENKRAKGQIKECQEALFKKEQDYKNLEKEKEQIQLELKSYQRRFDQEKLRGDQLSDKLNTKTIEFQKAQELLNQANKSLKLKDIQLQKSEAKVSELQNLLSQYTNMKEKNLSGQLSKQKEYKFGEVVNHEQQHVDLQFEDEEYAELEDAEILDEDNLANVKNVEFQKKAKDYLQNQQKSKEKTLGSKTQKTQEEIKTNGNYQDQYQSSTLPDELLCCVCLNKQKEVMIVSCKHLVYCKQCELQVNLKYPNHKICPICRKEYKKTLQILYT